MSTGTGAQSLQPALPSPTWLPRHLLRHKVKKSTEMEFLLFKIQNTKKNMVTEFLIFPQDWLQQHCAVQRHETRHARLRAARGAEGPLDDCEIL